MAPERDTFVEASKDLLKSTILDATRTLLTTSDWSKVTMVSVARVAGVSRQTVYSTFGSRQGLAEAYAVQVTEKLADSMLSGVDEHEGDLYTGVLTGVERMFAEGLNEPIVQALWKKEPHIDFIKLVSVDSKVIVQAGRNKAAQHFTTNWIHADEERTDRFVELVTRIMITYLANPPEDMESAIGALAEMANLYLMGENTVGSV